MSENLINNKTSFGLVNLKSSFIRKPTCVSNQERSLYFAAHAHILSLIGRGTS